jgi:hypothetical protein
MKPDFLELLICPDCDTPNHRWRIGNTFDLCSPQYASCFDHVEVFGWYEKAGLVRIRPTGPGSGIVFIATSNQLTTKRGTESLSQTSRHWRRPHA